MRCIKDRNAGIATARNWSLPGLCPINPSTSGRSGKTPGGPAKNVALSSSVSSRQCIVLRGTSRQRVSWDSVKPLWDEATSFRMSNARETDGNDGVFSL